ncbi:MAG: hypothetical protein GY757_19015 [bacterium]|nr:hypothetical protein [bacterium]
MELTRTQKFFKEQLEGKVFTSFKDAARACKCGGGGIAFDRIINSMANRGLVEVTIEEPMHIRYIFSHLEWKKIEAETIEPTI